MTRLECLFETERQTSGVRSARHGTALFSSVGSP